MTRANEGATTTFGNMIALPTAGDPMFVSPRRATVRPATIIAHSLFHRQHRLSFGIGFVEELNGLSLLMNRLLLEQGDIGFKLVRIHNIATLSLVPH